MRNKNNNASLSSLIINGGSTLCGEVNISGAKNSALPLLFSTILSDKAITINNVPNLSDIHSTINILKELGSKVIFHNNKVSIDASSINKFTACTNSIASMRASVLMLGPLLSRFGKAQTVAPGGCTIGKRPIDIHLQCLEKMGAKIEYSDKYIFLTANNNLQGTIINIEKASVGATENIIMAAILAKGVTKIINPAQEPEIVDLALFLKAMGAKIKGEGTNLIEIEGVNSLNPVNYTVCPDRIEAGSYLMAAAITKGNLTLNNINYNDINNIIIPLQEIGCTFTKLSSNKINIKVSAELIAKDITTAPYPNFSTDLQPQWTTLMCLAKGCSTINETIFENRLGHIKELQKMGANIEIIDKNHIFKVYGVKELQGTTVFPSDLRSSFALIMAGLVAKGITTIYNLSFLERGYEDVVQKLKLCGASINRINNNLEEN